MSVRFLAGSILATMLGLTSTAFASDQKSIYENVAASTNHTILLTAVKESGLRMMLDGKGTLTFFAPTDEAFKKLGEEEIKKLVSDQELLRKVLMAHVVVGTALTSADLNGKELNGFKVVAKDGLKIGEARVIAQDRKCSNGIMHTIDTVLIPK